MGLNGSIEGSNPSFSVPATERCPSGLRSATGNRVRAERCVAGSNPALSARLLPPPPGPDVLSASELGDGPRAVSLQAARERGRVLRSQLELLGVEGRVGQ